MPKETILRIKAALGEGRISDAAKVWVDCVERHGKTADLQIAGETIVLAARGQIEDAPVPAEAHRMPPARSLLG
jgi:hypothetical protein